MRSRAPDEHGFTLTELLVTVMIIGMIAYAISMVLIHALTIIPQSGSRSGAAADRAFFVDTFSDDVANSKGIVGSVNSPSCVDGPAIVPSWTNQWNLVTLATYSGDVVYRARVKSPNGYGPGAVNLLTVVSTVTIERVVPGVVPGSPEVVKVVFEGFCVHDNLNTKVATLVHTLASGGARHQTVSMTLRLRDAPDLPAATVNLQGAMRATG